MNKDHPPPNETGGSDDPAHLNSVIVERLLEYLRKINRAAPTAWVNEGWRLFAEYQNSRSPKHLRALSCHIAGIRARIAFLQKNISARRYCND